MVRGVLMYGACDATKPMGLAVDVECSQLSIMSSRERKSVEWKREL